MSDPNVIPELKQILGALLYAAANPLPLSEMRKIVQSTGANMTGAYHDFEKVTDADMAAAMDELRRTLEAQKVGVHVAEVANGFRLQNDVNCGPFLRFMLERGRPNRLSKPALETLAIIAYRQPCTRAEIEGVRGVAVDQIIRNLLEMQIIRIVGRSELPGRPWLFGTTQKFLEYFGLKHVKDLPGIAELQRMEEAQRAREAASKAEAEPVFEPAESPAALAAAGTGETTTDATAATAPADAATEEQDVKHRYDDNEDDEREDEEDEVEKDEEEEEDEGDKDEDKDEEEEEEEEEDEYEDDDEDEDEDEDEEEEEEEEDEDDGDDDDDEKNE